MRVKPGRFARGSRGGARIAFAGSSETLSPGTGRERYARRGPRGRSEGRLAQRAGPVPRERNAGAVPASARIATRQGRVDLAAPSGGPIFSGGQSGSGLQI